MSYQSFDSRDLEEELNNKETDKERMEAIKELKEETENYGWDHGIYFIPEENWEEYCQDFAYDCGYLDRHNEFSPLESCIDWKKWSDLMAMDYSTVTFEGNDYYYREA